MDVPRVTLSVGRGGPEGDIARQILYARQGQPVVKCHRQIGVTGDHQMTIGVTTGQMAATTQVRLLPRGRMNRPGFRSV